MEEAKREVVAICHECHKKIYKDDLIWEFYTSWGIEYIINTNKSERSVRCYDCYQDWLDEQKVSERPRKGRNWVLWGSLTLLLFSIFLLYYPNLVENWKSACWLELFVLLTLSIIISATLYSIISQLGKKRHEIISGKVVKVRKKRKVKK